MASQHQELYSQTTDDYGDIPSQMNEEQMRKYLAASSRIVMPDQKKRSSFDKLWNNGRVPFAQNNSQSNVNRASQAHKGQRPSESQTSHQHPHHHQQNYDDSMVSTTLFKQQTSENFNGHEIGRGSTFTIISEREKSDALTFSKQPVLGMKNAQFIAPRQPHTQSHPKPPQHTAANGHDNAQFPYNPKLNIQPLREAPHSTQQLPPHSAQQPQQPQHTNNNHQYTQPPVRSALSAQLAPQQHLGDSDKQSGMIQSRNGEGLMVFKQLPYSKKTHMMVHVFVEIREDSVEHVIVHFNKHITVQHFVDLLKHDTNDGAFKDTKLDIFCADDEGDLDDDFPPPGMHQVVAELNIKNFYIKIKGADEEQRDHLRRSTLAYKGGLQSTDLADKMYHIEDEEDEEEEEYEDDEDEEDDEDGQNVCAQCCHQCHIL